MIVLAAPVLASALSFRVFTTDNGLPQNSVYAIDQTPDGYLWIATHDGLVRFDGERMKVFNHAEVPEIRSNRVLALWVDHQGSLWLGTEDGGVTRMKGGAFRNFGTADGLPDSAVGTLREDEAGHIWAATWRGIFQFDGERWSTPEIAKPRPGESVDLYQLGLVRADGIRLLEPDGSFADYRWPPSPRRITHFQEPRGAYWTRVEARKLIRHERGVATVVDPPLVAAASPIGRFAVTRGHDGRTWLILDGHLSVLENGVWRTFTAPLPAPAANPIAIFEDLEGSLWIGGEEGLVQAFPTPVHTIVPDAEGDALKFYPIAEDRSGRVWAGTQAGSFRIEGERFTPLDALGMSAVRPEPDGTVLFGSYAGDLKRAGLDDRVFTLASVGTVSDIVRDQSGVIWVGMDGGVARVQTNGSVTRIGPADGLAGKRATALLESARGGIWVGCYGGLSKIEGGRVTTWSAKDGLSSETIRALHEDERGALWIGTYDGGITRFLDGKMVAIRKRDGLFDDGAFAIVDDGMGRFWMSCNRGLYVVERAQLDAFADGRSTSVTSRSFGRLDGMLTAECNGAFQPAGFRKSDGTLWFPTQQGIAIVDPRRVAANSVPPSVIIEEIASEHRDHAVMPSVTLDPSENRLEVRFTATTFVRPEQARFRYRMENLDDEWEDAGTARFARYSHVPPGRYVFRVIASNADGVWNEKGASVRIRVIPAWWQTLWFRGGTLVAAIGLAGLGVRSRFDRLRKRREEQDLFSRQLIASQEAERKRIAGELHDGIGQTLVVIRNRAQMGLRDGTDAGEARRQMEEIVEATGEGIEEVRKVAYNLRPYQLDRLGLTRAIEALVEQAAESSGLKIASKIDPLDGLFARDDEIGVYRIVQEALGNMLRYADAKQASVEARVAGRRVEIVVEDDGRGFDVAALPADRPGMGLSGIAERARILGGRHTIQSAPGRGTRIVVVLPAGGGA